MKFFTYTPHILPVCKMLVPEGIWRVIRSIACHFQWDAKTQRDLLVQGAPSKPCLLPRCSHRPVHWSLQSASESWVWSWSRAVHFRSSWFQVFISISSTLRWTCYFILTPNEYVNKYMKEWNLGLYSVLPKLSSNRPSCLLISTL